MVNSISGQQTVDSSGIIYDSLGHGSDSEAYEVKTFWVAGFGRQKLFG